MRRAQLGRKIRAKKIANMFRVVQIGPRQPLPEGIGRLGLSRAKGAAK